MRLIEYFLKPNRRVIYLYRLSERIREKNRFCRVCSTIIRNHLKVKYAIEFNNDERIGSGLQIFHFNGIVIGQGARIGENVKLYNNITVGGRRVDGKIEYPIIGNGVTIYPGARIIGGITVGDNAIVGPNTVLFENLGPGEIAVSAKYQTIVKKI